MKDRRFAILAAASIAWLVLPTAAYAVCAPTSSCSCTVTATPVSFGTYNPVGSDSLDGTGDITVDCAFLAALPGSYAIDLSTGVSGSYTVRTMKNGAAVLQYNLYTDAARTQIWGNNTGGSSHVGQPFLGVLAFQLHNIIYGRIFGSQNVPDGTYSDTILVTVTY